MRKCTYKFRKLLENVMCYLWKRKATCTRPLYHLQNVCSLLKYRKIKINCLPLRFIWFPLPAVAMFRLESNGSPEPIRMSMLDMKWSEFARLLASSSSSFDTWEKLTPSGRRTMATAMRLSKASLKHFDLRQFLCLFLPNNVDNWHLACWQYILQY